MAEKSTLEMLLAMLQPQTPTSPAQPPAPMFGGQQPWQQFTPTTPGQFGPGAAGKGGASKKPVINT